MPFVLHGMHEAAAATARSPAAAADHKKYAAAADAIADFVVRTQAAAGEGPAGGGGRAGTPAALAGAWPRAFDFGRWDYFASASDNGWGPFVFETGNGMSLFAQVLVMRARGTSTWEVLTQKPRSAALAAKVLELMPLFFD